MKAGIYRPSVESNHRAANSAGGRSGFPGNSYNPSLRLLVIGGGIWTTGTWNWSPAPVGRLLFRRSRSNAIIRAITPIAPTATPTPIPALAPDERSSLEEDSADVWVAVSAPVDGKDVDEDEEVVEDMDVVDVGVLLIFHPTTAIAPTVELDSKVVVDVTHAFVSDAGVDA